MTLNSHNSNPLLSNLNCIYRVMTFVPAIGKYKVDDVREWFGTQHNFANGVQPIPVPQHLILSNVCSSWRECVVDYSAAIPSLKSLISDYPTLIEDTRIKVTGAKANQLANIQVIRNWYKSSLKNNITWVLELLLRSGITINIQTKDEVAFLVAVKQKSNVSSPVTVKGIKLLARSQFVGPDDADLAECVKAFPELEKLDLEMCSIDRL